MKIIKATQGFLLSSSLLLGTALADNDLSIDDLPPPVRATVDREVGSGTIDDIEWETGPDGAYYEVEFERAGQEWELHIAEDGSVIRKHLD
jgi:hypothetical protein